MIPWTWPSKCWGFQARVTIPSTSRNLIVNTHLSTTVLFFCSCDLKKKPNTVQKQFREWKVYFSLHFYHRSKLGQVFKQVLKAETTEENMAGYLRGSCLASFLFHLWLIYLEMVMAAVGYSLPHQSPIKTVPYRHAYRSI